MQYIDGYPLVSFGSEIDEATIEQAKQTASMAFIYPHVALMPDAHFGMGSAVGTVIPTVGAVIPAAAGVDIGCGMTAVLTSYSGTQIADRDLRELRGSIESSIPLSPGRYNRRPDRFAFTAARLEELNRSAAEHGVDLSHSRNWRLQLGSLGGGNHFIELCIDERDRVWLFLHSGSRGVGYKIAQRHIRTAQRLARERRISLPNRDLAYLEEGTDEFDAYLRELTWAQSFAFENRAEMMDRFRQAFAYWMGIDPEEARHTEKDRVFSHHNYTRRENHAGKQVWLTRKGAIDAHDGVPGLIPGSMGARSYVVRGKGNPTSLCSAPHGAGRRYSRTQARKLFTANDLALAMQGVEYRHGDAWVDEIPQAYKDIDVVMADAADLVDVTAELRQVLNVKGT